MIGLYEHDHFIKFLNRAFKTLFHGYSEVSQISLDSDGFTVAMK